MCIFFVSMLCIILGSNWIIMWHAAAYIQSGRLCTLIWTGYEAELFAGNLVTTNDNLVQNIVQTCQFVLMIEYNQPTQNTSRFPNCINCMQNDVTTQWQSWDTFLKKPKPYYYVNITKDWFSFRLFWMMKLTVGRFMQPHTFIKSRYWEKTVALSIKKICECQK